MSVAQADITRLLLLGAPRLLTAADGQTLALNAKDAALLAVLALDGPQPRAALCTLLWPLATAPQAAANLRQRSMRLRKAAGLEVVALGPTVQLADGVKADATAPGALDLPTLLQVPTLLAGVDLGDHGELDLWLTQARQRVREAVVQALVDQAEALAQQRRLHEALPVARRVAELRPLSEQDARRLIRLHYLRGDRAAAQQAYWQLAELLRDELGVRPSAETQALLQTVEASAATPGGTRNPVPVSVHRPPVLVGRDAAWQAMHQAWQRPQPFLLVGDAGLGKTRLLDEFVRDRPGVCTERGQPGDADTPYLLLGRLLAQVAERHQPALPAAQRRELARLNPHFGTPPAAPAQAAMLWLAAEALLVAACAQGLSALVLDDLHHADTASLDALRWLSSSQRLGEPLRLGLATRPPAQADSPLLAWLADSHRPVRIDLAPLSPAELGQLLVTLALPALIDPAIGAHLHRHAGGNPLYTLATLHDAITQGADLRRSDWPRPQGVQALLDARVQALPEPARALLGVAAVFSADLRADLVADVLGQPLLALAPTWSLLEAQDILRGEAFSHELMHEAALRTVPQGLRQALHRQVAERLTQAGRTPAARLAVHWEQGERWAEAGACWHTAATAARTAGRLAEQLSLFERAAACHARAGDAAAGFEALHARLSALRLRHGGAAALAALPALEALAHDARQRLRLRLARAQAWLDGEHSAPALADTSAALQDLTALASHDDLRAQALTLHAQALAQTGDNAQALAAAEQALAAAQQPQPGDAPIDAQMAALNTLQYVHYNAGRLAEAAAGLRAVVQQAEACEDRAAAATAQGNLAALLAAIGDVPGTYALARDCRVRHAEIGLAQDSTPGIVNHLLLGAAAAALGRFDEAIDALQLATDLAGQDAAAGAQAKARISLANLWLVLGRPDAAHAAVADLPADILPAMQMQAALVRASAAAMAGRSAARHLDALARLAAAHPAPRLVQSAWFEWSHQGEPQAVIDRLQAVRAQCEAGGLLGTARALRWRELVRWLELAGPAATAAAAAHAAALWPHAVTGLSAKCHPPQTLLTLAQAFDRAGQAAEVAACRDAACAWLDAALPRVPPAYRAGFIHGQPANRHWLAGAGGRR